MTTIDRCPTAAFVERPPARAYRGYIFDLDGTIYLGNELLPGAKTLIERLRAENRRVLFLSNNPTRDPAMYVKKLTCLGIPVDEREVMNSISTLVAWLEAHRPGAKVFVIGETPVQTALMRAGFDLTERPEEIDVVVASYDRSLVYRKLQIAFDALWRHKRAILVATNPDRYCPLANGGGEPDTAATVAAIEACTGVSCRANVGKPSRLMLDAALARLGLTANECLMVGDRLSTDIAMGVAGNMDSAVVLTGETTANMLIDISDDQSPTWVVNTLESLLP